MYSLDSNFHSKMTSVCKCTTLHLHDFVHYEWLSEVLDEESTWAALWTMLNEDRCAQGRNPLDETIYDEGFWMGVDVPNDNGDDMYDADAEDNENDN